MKSKTGLLLPFAGLVLSKWTQTTQHIGGAFHFTGKTGLAIIATVAANGKHVIGWRFW